MPGERGFDLAEKRIAGGIPIAAGTVTRLAVEAAKRDIAIPRQFQ
jgi:ureidoglycolate dehydrogenase (NAD+)